MTKLTEVAKNFAESAKQQRETTEQAVTKEFKKLNDAIKKASASAESTYLNDMQNQRRKTALWQTLAMIPILVAFSLGVLIALWLTMASNLAIVQVETLKNGSQWVHCQELSDNKAWCKIKEGS